MTTEHIIIAVLVIIAILGFIGLATMMSATVDEAERKLGREMTGVEYAVAFAFVVFVPYSFPIALAYVWLVMPDKSGEKAQ